MRLILNEVGFQVFVPSLKCGPISAAIQSAGNLAAQALASGFNYKIAKETNESNERNVAATNLANLDIANANNQTQIQLAKEANDLNYKMFIEANAWNENMWEKENEYNDPSNQIKRLIDAGINPNMVGAPSGGSNNPTGTAGSAPSSVASAPAVIPQLATPSFEAAIANPYEMLPVNLDFLGPMMQAAGIEKTRSETKGIEIANQMKNFEAEQLPTNMYLEQDFKKWQTESAKAQVFKYNASGMLDLQKISESDATTYFTYVNARAVDKQREECEQRIAFAKDMHPKQMRELDATWDRIQSEIKAYEASAKASIASAAESYATAGAQGELAQYYNAQTTGLDIDNQTRHEANLQQIRESVAATRYQQMLTLTEGTKWTKAEKEAVSKFLAENPEIKPSTVINALKDVRNMDEKQLRAKYGASVARFAVGVVTGLVVGASTGNPVLGLGAGAAVAGAPMGAVINPSMAAPKPNPIGFNQ